MSSYLRSIPFTMDFDGDKITARLKPLKQVHAVRMQSLPSHPEVRNGRNLEVFEPKDLLEFYVEIIPVYVEEFAGLRAMDGSPVTLQEMVEVNYFSAVVFALGAKITSTGVVPKAPDPKTPASPLTDTSMVLPSEATLSAGAA